MELSRLKDEFPYKWKVQSFSKYRASAICIPYVDARQVADHLDAVVGPGGWQSDYKEVHGKMLAGIGIKVGSEWVWKWDTGSESKIEKDKGLASDSFKRAAIKWGVGRFVYFIGHVNCPANEKKTKDNFPYVVDGSKKRVYDLTEYITKTLTGKESDEDKKVAAYWIEQSDLQKGSQALYAWYNSNHGDIGKYLDDVESNKLLKHLGDMKRIYLAQEEVKCPKDDDGGTVVTRAVCEECPSKTGCPEAG